MFNDVPTKFQRCSYSQYIGVTNYYVSHGISTNPRWKCLCTRNRVLDRKNSMYTIALMFSNTSLPYPNPCFALGEVPLRSSVVPAVNYRDVIKTRESETKTTPRPYRPRPRPRPRPGRLRPRPRPQKSGLDRSHVRNVVV